MESIPFPATVDEPPYLLLWRLDDIALPLFCLCIGMLLGSAAIFISIGVAGMLWYRRFREGRPEFYVLHALYWTGAYPARGLGFLNPYIRTLLP